MERTQPSWLMSLQWRWIYLLASRLIAGLILGLIFLSVFTGPRWLILCPIAGLAVGFIDAIRFEKNRKPFLFPSASSHWKPILLILEVGLSVALTVSIVSGLVTSLYIPQFLSDLFAFHFADLTVQFQTFFSDLVSHLRFWLNDGLVAGAIFGFIFGLRAQWQNADNDIQVVSALAWSGRQALLGAIIGLLVWPVFEIIHDLSLWFLDDLTIPLIQLITAPTITQQSYPFLDRLSEGWNLTGAFPILWLYYSLRGLLIGALVFGLTTKSIDESSHGSHTLSLKVGPLFAIVGIIVSWIGHRQELYYLGGQDYSIRIALQWGVLFWSLAFLRYGGLDTIQHGILQLILRVQRLTPFPYRPFLNHATDAIILQRVGPGYRFIHRLLQDHLAAQYRGPSQNQPEPNNSPLPNRKRSRPQVPGRGE
jgi:hypothetical protein